MRRGRRARSELRTHILEEIVLLDWQVCVFITDVCCCCLLMQYLIQSSARGGRRIVEDM
jgi:hypothetical protein